MEVRCCTLTMIRYQAATWRLRDPLLAAMMVGLDVTVERRNNRYTIGGTDEKHTVQAGRPE
jgi:hypothetical protein